MNEWKGGGLVPVLRHNKNSQGSVMHTNRSRTKDRHKAPTSTPPFPLSLQTVIKITIIRFSRHVMVTSVRIVLWMSSPVNSLHFA